MLHDLGQRVAVGPRLQDVSLELGYGFAGMKGISFGLGWQITQHGADTFHDIAGYPTASFDHSMTPSASGFLRGKPDYPGSVYE